VRKTATPVASLQFVSFRLDDTEFAVDVFTVQEILRYKPVIPVPEAPDFVRGVIDVRGRLLPVIDLRRRFGVESPMETGATRIMVAGFDGDQVGLVVDAVSEVMRVPASAVVDPPPYIRSVAAGYVRGIVRLEDRLVVVIELSRVLGSDELIALRDLERLLEKARTEMRDAESNADQEENSGGSGS
jgi:purine-binding chemotaxis protein CheW